MASKKLLSSIYENSKNVLNSMAGVKASLLRIGSVDLQTSSSEYCVTTQITGFLNCVVVVSFDLKTGLALASHLTGKNDTLGFSNESESALCELTNIIIGNTMNSLDSPEFHVSVSPPAFTKGKVIGFFMPEASMASMISLDIGMGILKIFISSKKEGQV